jgi:ribonuclease-3
VVLTDSPEEIFGYRFRDRALLDAALTTPSCKMDNPRTADNQRLEFLGDAVLGLLSAVELYGRFPHEGEGALTVMRTQMVSSSALCRAAAKHGLAAKLRRNRAAGELPPNSKTIADAVEAIIGAAYLDGGFEAAGRVFAALGVEVHDSGGKRTANPKGDLQIKAQAMKPPRQPSYELVSVDGKAHCPFFTVRVSVDGLGEAEAGAPTRREAEARAAAKLLGCDIM